MKLLLRRSQKSGMISSKITFALDARAELTPQEKEYVHKYKMGKTILYSKKQVPQEAFEKGWHGIKAFLKFLVTNIKVSVNDLVNGKQLEAKDILEMVAIEEQIKEAAASFKIMLDTAAQFGGEEVIQI